MTGHNDLTTPNYDICLRDRRNQIMNRSIVRLITAPAFEDERKGRTGDRHRLRGNRNQPGRSYDPTVADSCLDLFRKKDYQLEESDG